MFFGPPVERKKFLEVFKKSQCRFAVRCRFYKRHSQRGRMLNLKKTQTSNPKRFWSEIKNWFQGGFGKYSFRCWGMMAIL